MRRFNVRQVEAFRSVVALGSMTKAAEVLGISQPAVSRLIVDFEEAVGLRLFRRQRGGAEPTDDARRLYGQVEKLFVGLEELNLHLHAIKSLAAGSVSIVAMDIYANGFLPEIIGGFRTHYPQITVTLESQPHDRIADWVMARRSEIGFTTLPVPNGNAPARELMQRAALCVFPAQHPFSRLERIAIEDLAGHPFVSFVRGTPFRYEIDALFERAGVERAMMTEATTHEAVCNLVAEGLGVSVVSPFSPHVRRSPHLAFRPFLPAIPIKLGIIADTSGLSVAAQHFHDFAVDHVARLQKADTRPRGRRNGSSAPPPHEPSADSAAKY